MLRRRKASPLVRIGRFIPLWNAPAANPDGAGAALNNPGLIFALNIRVSFILQADSSMARGVKTEAGPGFSSIRGRIVVPRTRCFKS